MNQQESQTAPAATGPATLDVVIPVYNEQEVLPELLRRLAEDFGQPVAAGEFGADMKVSLVNDGPVTIIIDSKTRE